MLKNSNTAKSKEGEINQKHYQELKNKKALTFMDAIIMKEKVACHSPILNTAKQCNEWSKLNSKVASLEAENNWLKAENEQLKTENKQLYNRLLPLMSQEGNF